ncbi:MAG: phosphatase PAP2 family protein, partial [Deltaproteobacteria bacterium]|nr:phosphatase PAP2 family protein [Deltaproteobacteria bacterium]
MVVILLCAAEAVSFTGIPAKSPLRELPHILSGNYFFGAVMAGVFVMHLVLVVSRLEILLVTAAATVFFAVFYLIDASSGGGVLLVQQAAVGAGFASIAALAIRTAASKGEGRENTLSVLLPAIFLPLLMLLFQFCLDLTASIFPATLDPVVYAADMAFGTQLSFVLGDLLADNPLFLRATFAGYFALPAALAFIYGIERKSIAPPRLDIITSFIGIVIAGYAVYLFFPVAGPKFAFYGAYPDFMPPLADIISHEKIIVTPVPRNCMPSLHTALALIIFWHSRSFAPRVRVLTGFFLAATVFSTVALGFHYVVDVIAAVPFTVAMEAISAAAVGNSSREVRRAAVSGSLLAAAWLILLRYGTSLIVDYREIFWVFSAATIPVSLYIKKILDREIYAEALPEN